MGLSYKSMKRYLVAIVSTVLVVATYQMINIRLFTLDITRHTRDVLFSDLRSNPPIDTSIVLLNLGKLKLTDIDSLIEPIKKCQPKVIGINLCHFNEPTLDFQKRYANDQSIVFVTCDRSQSNTRSGAIIDLGNKVTRFRTDHGDYFESRLTNFKGTGNPSEIINFGSKHFFRVELAQQEWWTETDLLKDKIALVGYMGDYLTDSLYYFTSSRITPLNEHFGESNMLPDMYDIEISGHIVSMINFRGFIHELDLITRVVVLLLISVFSVLILTYSKTRWIALNIVIAGIQFVVLAGFGSFLIVYLFDKGYYLNIDELPLSLVIVAAVTSFLNIVEENSEVKSN